jgi:hypothetical protein
MDLFDSLQPQFFNNVQAVGLGLGRVLPDYHRLDGELVSLKSIHSYLKFQTIDPAIPRDIFT